MTQPLIKFLVPTSDPCDFESNYFKDCKNEDKFKANLAESLKSVWTPVVTIFRVMAVLFFVKQLLAIYKHIVAQKHVDAAKSFAYLVLGTFLMFDLANTIWLAFQFREAVEKIIEAVTNLIDKGKTTPGKGSPTPTPTPTVAPPASTF